MIVGWQDYLAVPGAEAAYADCRARCGGTFACQRACVSRLLDSIRPRTVACLGAGVLNDIPYQRLVAAGATVHLVDWLPGAPEFGVARSIVERTCDGRYRCAYCRHATADANVFCLSYADAGPDSEVCAAFRPSATEPLTCLAYRKGTLPFVHRQDVSGGYASAFGEGVPQALRGVASWRQALRRATALAKRVKGRQRALDIAERSVDLAISSMLLSQFEHEPYGYFSKQAAALLGPPSAKEASLLQGEMEALRSILLREQVLGHCREVARMLADDGRWFVAVEMFHRDDRARDWYLVREMHETLGMLAERFRFRFDGDPDPAVDPGFRAGTGRSVVQHFVLAPKARRRGPSDDSPASPRGSCGSDRRGPR